MRPFEIYNATVAWRNCADMRPWLIVDCRPGDIFGCFPFSGQCYDGNCFEVPASHVNFAATGLTKSCFILDSHIIEIPISAFSRRRGELAGALLSDFRKYAGI